MEVKCPPVPDSDYDIEYHLQRVVVAVRLSSLKQVKATISSYRPIAYAGIITM